MGATSLIILAVCGQRHLVSARQCYCVGARCHAGHVARPEFRVADALRTARAFVRGTLWGAGVLLLGALTAVPSSHTFVACEYLSVTATFAVASFCRRQVGGWRQLRARSVELHWALRWSPCM